MDTEILLECIFYSIDCVNVKLTIKQISSFCSTFVLQQSITNYVHIRKAFWKLHEIYKQSRQNLKKTNSWKRRLHHDNDPLPLYHGFVYHDLHA